MQFLPVGDNEDAVAHLRHTMEGCIDQRVLRVVPQVVQRLDDLLGHVVVRIVEYVGDILDQQCQRLKRAHVVEVA